MTLNRSKMIESMLENLEHSMSQVNKSGLPLDSTQLRAMLDEIRRTLANIKDAKSGKEVHQIIFDEHHNGIITGPCGQCKSRLNPCPCGNVNTK